MGRQLTILVSMFLAFSLTACGSGGNGDSAEGTTGTVRVLVTDAPFPVQVVESATVVIREVSVRAADGLPHQGFGENGGIPFGRFVPRVSRAYPFDAPGCIVIGLPQRLERLFVGLWRHGAFAEPCPCAAAPQGREFRARKSARPSRTRPGASRV